MQKTSRQIKIDMIKSKMTGPLTIVTNEAQSLRRWYHIEIRKKTEERFGQPQQFATEIKITPFIGRADLIDKMTDAGIMPEKLDMLLEPIYDGESISVYVKGFERTKLFLQCKRPADISEILADNWENLI